MMGLNWGRWMKVLRADISALLLIAFVFQLLTPVVVLASEKSLNSEFEEALRASICRVYVDPAAEDVPSHTDNFVCDWCVLCSLDTQANYDPLPEVVFSSPLAGLPQSNGRDLEGLPVSEIRGSPSAPRAPPAV